MDYAHTLQGRPVFRSPLGRRAFNVNHRERFAARPDNLVSFNGELLQEAEHAYLVGFGATAVWVPISLAIDVEAGGLHEPISMMLPQWFTELEGLD